MNPQCNIKRRKRAFITQSDVTQFLDSASLKISPIRMLPQTQYPFFRNKFQLGKEIFNFPQNEREPKQHLIFHRPLRTLALACLMEGESIPRWWSGIVSKKAAPPRILLLQGTTCCSGPKLINGTRATLPTLNPSQTGSRNKLGESDTD
ncbi:hypothetical protein CEXT_410271 [Caerostris extrusa]|uniref:Uncharacterized protein n=1 Tax=Caerostris extrusa TaxID=172846 RepID=A0AAV4UNB3_CAEEX|nr:hypothetical protein CEXT_410271 [Caerostris extrusa]